MHLCTMKEVDKCDGKMISVHQPYRSVLLLDAVHYINTFVSVTLGYFAHDTYRKLI